MKLRNETLNLFHRLTYVKYLILPYFLVLVSCYSFKGISIPNDIQHYFVSDFEITDLRAPADINQKFSELLREKIRNESRLVYQEIDPHIEFSGAISKYNVSAVAPTQGNVAALNRLDIGVKVDYSSNLNEDDNWTQTFSFYQDFESDQDLQSVQDQLIEDIFEQLVEDVFNKAFTNW